MNVRRTLALSGVCVALALASSAGAATTVAPSAPPEGARSAAAFRAANPGSNFYLSGERITSVYGNAFSSGASPVVSAERFLEKYAAMFGVDAPDLAPGSLAGEGAHALAFLPDLDDGHLRFTLVSYLQTKDGIPVFRGDVRLVVRNEEGFPLTLVRSGLIDLNGFVPDAAVAAAPDVRGAFADAMKQFPGIGNFSIPQVVIWAGTETVAAAPTLAVSFEGTVADNSHPDYQKWLILADAATGAIVYTESLINHIDVTGSVKGMHTPGKKADICATEVLTPMPYARVSIGATVAYADAAGNFTIPNAGTTAVTVQSGARGRWFQTHLGSSGGAEPELMSLSVTPPGPANFVHNSPNTNATHRSAVNAYVQSNIVRDYTLLYCPTFPTIGSQTQWPVNINVSGSCNAFYDGASINFYAAGGGCPSTAFGDVVHHEYGHHLVNRAGSGQGQYGEGYGDVMGVLISDEPVLGYGFTGNCNAGIRNANNSLQYPQNGEIHDAGQLISGCVWSTRNALIGPFPSTYKDVLGSLAVNSMLLHNGDLITPQITIDWLTLNDDNANINDGTPHYTQINAGFTAHNMDGPPLILMNITFPQGIPDAISPDGGQEFTVQVTGVGATPQENTGVLHVDPEGDGTFAPYPMPQLSPNLYGAVFPPTTCGSLVAWYVSAKTTTNVSVFSPENAPSNSNHALSAVTADIAFVDNFETATGWTATMSVPLSSVKWTRDNPDGILGRPSDDFDGSGKCMFTKNFLASTNISGVLTLISPVMDASAADYTLSYGRWFSNNTGNNPGTDSLVIEISNDNGTSWVNLETVGPTGPQTSGGWFARSYRLADVIAPTAQVKVRFVLQDVGGVSTIAAAVDDFRLQNVSCGCPADYNGDGFVDGIDSDLFNNDFEAGNPAADFNGDGFVDGIDSDEFNNAFEAGC